MLRKRMVPSLPPILPLANPPTNHTTVLQKPLHQHSSKNSSSSTTSSATSGYCNASNPIAANLTNAFLDLLSSSTSTDLRKNGVGPGERYCVSASQWKSAVDKGGADVPKVKLECTHVTALDTVDLSTLKKYAAGQDVDRGVEWTSDKKSGAVKESSEIGGKEPRA